MATPQWIPLGPRYESGLSPEAAAKAFHDTMHSRRSVRMFSDRPVSQETVEWIVRSATTAPNGANKQPWRFVCVKSPKLKQAIRLGAEKEEREFYQKRASKAWLKDIEPLGTDENKDFLEIAPWLIVVFRLARADGGSQTYYTQESAGIAVGLLLAAAHHAGLVTLTHTPSPMKFLTGILDRPENERPFLLIPVGYPAGDCVVPAAAVTRKPLGDVMVVV